METSIESSLFLPNRHIKFVWIVRGRKTLQLQDDPVTTGTLELPNRQGERGI